MAPQFPPDDVVMTVKRSPSTPNTTTLAIVCAVLGGLMLIATVTAILICFFRSRRVRERSTTHASKSQASIDRLIHKRSSSEATVTPLLQGKLGWTIEHGSNERNSLGTSPYRNSDDSLGKEKQLDEIILIGTLQATPFVPDSSSSRDTLKRSLPRLSIPQSSTCLSTNQQRPSDPTTAVNHMSPPSSTPSSVNSDSSESLYSQPSASSLTPFPPTPPPIPAPKSANETDGLIRADTRVISRMLKKRAERNPKPPSRSVSHIERVDSIKSLSHSGDDEVPPLPSRPRSKKMEMVASRRIGDLGN